MDTVTATNLDEMKAMLDQMAVDFTAQSARAQDLMKADPRLPYVSALVIAGDLASADRSFDWLRGGMDFDRALTMTGSYGRMPFVIRALEAGLVGRAKVLGMLPELWSDSDPDDSDPRYLALWKEAAFTGTVIDGKPLPAGKVLTIYRGQDADAPKGIAWSLSKTTAAKFARGAATRQSNRGGIVLRAHVARKDVLAYLTGRNEDEIIVDMTTLIG